MAFIVDVKVKGNKATFYLRENKKSFSKSIEFEHVIPTWPKAWKPLKDEISKIAESNPHDKNFWIVKDPNLKELGIKIQKVPYAMENLDLNTYSDKMLQKMENEWKKAFVFWAIGNPVMKKYLTKSFITRDQRNNTARMLRWNVNYPFSLFEDNSKKVPLEELLDEKKVAIDLETRKNNNSIEIFLCPIITNDEKFGNYLLCKDNLGNDKLTVHTHFGDIELKVINNVKNIGKTMTDILHSYDFLFAFIHNANFDVKTARELEKDFLPGIGFTKPIIEAGSSYFKRWDFGRGKLLIDTYPFAQHWLWTPDNKLITVANYVFNTHLEKDLDYETLEKYAQLSRTNQKYTKICAEYNVKDTILHFKLGDEFLKDLLLLSYMFRQKPSRVALTAKNELSNQLHEEQQFKKLHTYSNPQPQEKEDLKKFDVNKEKIRLLELNKIKIKKGIHNCCLIYPTPFIEGLLETIKDDPYADEVYKEFKTTTKKHKIILAQALDAYLRRALYFLKRDTGLEKHLDVPFWKRTKDFIFSRLYGIKPEEYNTSIIKANNNIIKKILVIKNFLKDKYCINYSNKFLLLKGNIDAKELEEKNLAINLGYGKAISLEKSRFAINIDGQLISQGIDLSGSKGDKTKLETKLIKELYEIILFKNDKSKLLQLIDESLNSLHDKKELVYEKEIKQDFYSAKAQSREWIQVKNLYGLREGNIIRYGYALGFEHPILAYHEGELENPPKENFFDDKYILDKARYINKFYGHKIKSGRSLEEGSLGEIIYSTFCFENGKLVPEKKEALCRIIDRTAKADDYSLLLKEQLELL